MVTSATYPVNKQCCIPHTLPSFTLSLAQTVMYSPYHSLPYPFPCAVDDLRFSVQSRHHKWQTALHHVHTAIHTHTSTSGLVEFCNHCSKVTAQEGQVRQCELPLDIVLHRPELGHTQGGRGERGEWRGEDGRGEGERGGGRKGEGERGEGRGRGERGEGRGEEERGEGRGERGRGRGERGRVGEKGMIYLSLVTRPYPAQCYYCATAVNRNPTLSS